MKLLQDEKLIKSWNYATEKHPDGSERKCVLSVTNERIIYSCNGKNYSEKKEIPVSAVQSVECKCEKQEQKSNKTALIITAVIFLIVALIGFIMWFPIREVYEDYSGRFFIGLTMCLLGLLVGIVALVGLKNAVNSYSNAKFYLTLITNIPNGVSLGLGTVVVSVFDKKTATNAVVNACSISINTSIAEAIVEEIGTVILSVKSSNSKYIDSKNSLSGENKD